MIFLFRLLSRLPLGWVHALGGLAGRLTYWLSPTYRRHLKANLSQAGLDRNLALPAAAEAGKQALELSRIWLRTLEEANA